MTTQFLMPSSALCARRFAVGAVLSLWTMVPAFCQTPYETRLYRPPVSTLEPNYGLPSFGMPGSELPKQRTMATQRATSSEPDFLASLGARTNTNDDMDDFKKKKGTKALGETPDSTTSGTLSDGDTDRQGSMAPE